MTSVGLNPYKMANINPLNVYPGPESMKKYFDPDCQPPLPLVEIPQALNPFYDDGVRIYAKMMSMHPANNVKAIPGKQPIPVSIGYNADAKDGYFHSSESLRGRSCARKDKDRH